MGLNGFIKLGFFLYGFLFQSFIDPEKIVPGSGSVVFYFGFSTNMVYLNMVWTATMVLQSARVSSREELELSLLTMTTLSARLMPARSKSSKL